MLQMRLAELGYYGGTITGGYYGGTIKAVEAFQRDYGLDVDGAAGEKTQAVLFSSACDPTPEPLASTAPSPTPMATASPMPTDTPRPTAAPAPTPFVPLPGSVG